MKYVTTLFISLVFILISSWGFSKPVDKETARQAATIFYFERASQFYDVAFKDLALHSEFTEMSEGHILFYTFNFSRGGWVMLAADDRIVPVIAYSFHNSLDHTPDADNFNWWMRNVKDQIMQVISEDLPGIQEAANQWAELLAKDAFNAAPHKEKAVGPLMLSKWNQGKYYNAMCPVTTGGPDGRALVGCVATSMAQVMFYYRWPVQGQGVYGGINFGSTYYRWNEMLNSLSNYNTGVAQISYHAGKAVGMTYGATGSSASTSNVPGAMANRFRYNSAINFALKWPLYTDANWQNKIKANLNLNRPVIYSGYDPSAGGHAWVCDGYQGTNHFHMNWGWGGSGDGYFYLDALSIAGNNFSNNQGGVFDMYPAGTSYPPYCTGTTTVPYSFGTIADGSGPVTYQNNTNCSWLISPTEPVSKITVSCNAINTEENNDVITIYDGDNTGAPVLATWSGTTIPTPVQSSGDKVLVRFTTNGSATAPGWQLQYNSTYPVYCSGINTLTSAAGSIDDGSGSNNYSYNQLCRWRIWPTGAGSVTIAFTQFNVASDDWLKISDENTSTDLVTHTGTAIPPPATYTTDKLLLTFKTNGVNNAPGWALNYTSSPLGISGGIDPGSIVVYPNPAKDKLFVDIHSDKNQQITLNVFATDGRRVYIAHRDICPGKYSEEVSLSGLSSGLYFLSITTESGIMNTRIVVE